MTSAWLRGENRILADRVASTTLILSVEYTETGASEYVIRTRYYAGTEVDLELVPGRGVMPAQDPPALMHTLRSTIFNTSLQTYLRALRELIRT